MQFSRSLPMKIETFTDPMLAVTDSRKEIPLMLTHADKERQLGLGETRSEVWCRPGLLKLKCLGAERCLLLCRRSCSEPAVGEIEMKNESDQHVLVKIICPSALGLTVIGQVSNEFTVHPHTTVTVKFKMAEGIPLSWAQRESVMVSEEEVAPGILASLLARSGGNKVEYLLHPVVEEGYRYRPTNATLKYITETKDASEMQEKKDLFFSPKHSVLLCHEHGSETMWKGSLLLANAGAVEIYYKIMLSDDNHNFITQPPSGVVHVSKANSRIFVEISVCNLTALEISHSWYMLEIQELEKTGNVILNSHWFCFVCCASQEFPEPGVDVLTPEYLALFTKTHQLHTICAKLSQDLTKNRSSHPISIDESCGRLKQELSRIEEIRKSGVVRWKEMDFMLGNIQRMFPAVDSLRRVTSDIKKLHEDKPVPFTGTSNPLLGPVTESTAVKTELLLRNGQEMPNTGGGALSKLKEDEDMVRRINNNVDRMKQEVETIEEVVEKETAELERKILETRGEKRHLKGLNARNHFNEMKRFAEGLEKEVVEMTDAMTRDVDKQKVVMREGESLRMGVLPVYRRQVAVMLQVLGDLLQMLGDTTAGVLVETRWRSIHRRVAEVTEAVESSCEGDEVMRGDAGQTHVIEMRDKINEWENRNKELEKKIYAGKKEAMGLCEGSKPTNMSLYDKRMLDNKLSAVTQRHAEIKRGIQREVERVESVYDAERRRMCDMCEKVKEENLEREVDRVVSYRFRHIRSFVMDGLETRRQEVDCKMNKVESDVRNRWEEIFMDKYKNYREVYEEKIADLAHKHKQPKSRVTGSGPRQGQTTHKKNAEHMQREKMQRIWKIYIAFLIIFILLLNFGVIIVNIVS